MLLALGGGHGGAHVEEASVCGGGALFVAQIAHLLHGQFVPIVFLFSTLLLVLGGLLTLVTGRR